MFRVNFRRKVYSCTLTTNKVRFQDANALKFIYITVDHGCLKEQIIASYYVVEGIGKRKTKEEIQSDKGKTLTNVA